MKIENLNNDYKIKLMRAISRGIKFNLFKKSKFLDHLAGEIFILTKYEWSDKPKFYVNGKQITKPHYDAIKTICSEFFNPDEFLLIECPKWR